MDGMESVERLRQRKTLLLLFQTVSESVYFLLARLPTHNLSGKPRLAGQPLPLECANAKSDSLLPKVGPRLPIDSKREFVVLRRPRCCTYKAVQALSLIHI